MLSDYPWFNNITENLALAKQNNRFPHGLLLAAPALSGKVNYAKALANSLLCSTNPAMQAACGQCKNCLLFNAASHPDFHWLDRLVDNKGKQKQSIGIDQIRSLNDKLQDTAQLSGWRIAIISSVTAMTRASFNALLKTLEEPGRDTLLLLLTDNIQQVPATIRSRCQLLLPDLTDGILVPWLQAQTVSHEQSDKVALKEALTACHGAPLAARDYLVNQGASKRLYLFDLLDQVFINQITPSEFLMDKSIALEDLPNQLCDYFNNRQQAISCAKADKSFSNMPNNFIFKLYDKLMDYNRAQQSGSNLQMKIQIEEILIQWFEIGKKISHYS